MVQFPALFDYQRVLKGYLSSTTSHIHSPFISVRRGHGGDHLVHPPLQPGADHRCGALGQWRMGTGEGKTQLATTRRGGEGL